MRHKKVWRMIFSEFQIGDKIQITNQTWIYRNLEGIIVDKTWETRGYYLVRFKKRDLALLRGRTELWNDLPKHSRGWFKYEDMILIG